MENTHNYVKIVFRLIQDKDGYPPATSETLWAKKISNNKYEIDNIPFYVKNVSPGDIVSTEYKENELVYKKTLFYSKNSIIRVVIMDKKRMLEIDNLVRENLKNIGCKIEIFKTGFFSVELAPEINLKLVIDYLKKEEAKGLLGYEEGSLRRG